MKSLAVFLVLAFLSVDQSWAKAGPLPTDVFESADLIARVRIDDDLEVIPTPQYGRDYTAEGIVSADVVKAATSAKPSEYRKLATASIIQTFKGGKAGEKIQIRHTNDLVCPNIHYKKGGQYLVFLTREPDSSAYVTMSTYNGQFLIEDDQIFSPYRIPGYNGKFSDPPAPYARVANFLRDAVAKAKQ